MKLLIVEDNGIIVKGLEYLLIAEKFEVVIKTNSKDAKISIDENEYDLIILDISLPDGNGFDVCKYVKSKSDIPVIFLTARDEERNIVYGLDMGADDYITKPFKMRELISRINTILRRYKKIEINKNILKVKDITIDVNKAQVFKGKKEVVLTALEYKILLMLFSNMNIVMTREQILDKIWDVAGNFVNDNTLTVYIKRIREKLEDDQVNPNIIKTLRGIGYKVEG